MKKLLFIFVLISAAFIAHSQDQTPFVDLPEKTTIDGTDQRVVVDGTTVYRMTTETLLSDVTDSLDKHTDTLQVHQDQIATLQAGVSSDSSWTSIQVDTVHLPGTANFITRVNSSNEPLQIKSTDGIQIIGSQSDVTSIGRPSKRIDFTNNDMTIVDDEDDIGIEYNADYSANATARSLLDSAHIASMIADKAPIADPTFTGAIGIGGTDVDETELAILEGATTSTNQFNFLNNTTSDVQAQIDGKQSLNYTNINVETATTYTFVIADDDEYTTFTNGSAVLVTIPANSAVAFPIGATIDCEQEGAGTVTFQTEDGVVELQAFGSDTVSAGQGAVFTLIKKATNTWRLTGTL